MQVDRMLKKENIRYLLVLICCCLMAASSVGVYTNSVGVFYTKVSADLGVGRGAFALHATLCALTAGFLCPVAARVLKKAPSRILILGGSILSAGSTALMALATNVWAFYILGILRGIGMTMFSLMPVTTFINNWFHEKHGMAVGIALSFSGLAGAVFSPLFSSMIGTIGWRASFLWMGAIGFALTVPAMLIMHYRPDEISLLPFGMKKDSAGSASDTARGISAPEKAAQKIYIPALVVLSLMTVLHTSVTGIAQHFPGISEWMGSGAAVGAAMVSAGMIGNIVSKLIIGTLSDRIGPFKASMCMIIINALAILGLLLFGGKASWLMFTVAFFYGTVYAVGAVGIPLQTRKLFGTQNYSSAYSIITIFTSIGSASALTIIGLIYDLTGGYTAALVAGLTIDLINLIILVVLARMHTRRQHAVLQ